MRCQCLCTGLVRGNQRYVKFLLALLAILTGFSVADGVRIAEPAIAEVDDGLRGAWTSDETRPNIAITAVFMAATILPLVLACVPAMRWTSKPALRTVASTVHRSDRLLQ